MTPASTISSVSLPALRLHRVARRFGRRWALRGVSLEVEAGELVGIMGHNGSGKSTLLRVVATALKPSAGEGWVYGHHLVRDAHAVRAVIGFLAHHPGLYDDLTAHENLLFATRMLGHPETGIAAVLERVGLAREAHERVRGFSAGMQRRLALARLVLAGPRLLLLDEPYNNFDADGIELVNDVIRDARDSGGAALVVLHDRRQGEHLLDRVVELVRGAAAEPVDDARSAQPALRVAQGQGGGR
ncbi:MAG TPA: heme ABC exporter ATP-binding protein CcmA [Gemmatimonadaceae bacterium]|nr:heme ABC exporter ATP-binding protein CcmA [Gemmatimonadaceae bacterium]